MIDAMSTSWNAVAIAVLPCRRYVLHVGLESPLGLRPCRPEWIAASSLGSTSMGPLRQGFALDVLALGVGGHGLVHQVLQLGFLGLVRLQDPQPLHLDFRAELLVGHLPLELDLVLLGDLDGHLEPPDHRSCQVGRKARRPVRPGSSARRARSPCRDRSRAVGGPSPILVPTSALSFWAAKASASWAFRVVDLPSGLRLVVGELRQQAIDLRPQALIERVTRGRDLGEKDPRPWRYHRSGAPPGPSRRGSRHPLARRAWPGRSARRPGLQRRTSRPWLARRAAWPPGSCRS